jgi:hypothetical protein
VGVSRCRVPILAPGGVAQFAFAMVAGGGGVVAPPPLPITAGGFLCTPRRAVQTRFCTRSLYCLHSFFDPDSKTLVS